MLLFPRLRRTHLSDRNSLLILSILSALIDRLNLMSLSPL